MDSYDELIQKFMEDHEELFKEAKWCLLIDIIKDARGTTEPAIVDSVLRFVNVFRAHGVDPDVVIEAFSALSTEYELKKEKDENDISTAELTNFVNVLNKMRKKGEENASEG